MYFLHSGTLITYTLNYIYYHSLNIPQLKYQNKFFTNFQILPFFSNFQSVFTQNEKGKLMQCYFFYKNYFYIKRNVQILSSLIINLNLLSHNPQVLNQKFYLILLKICAVSVFKFTLHNFVKYDFVKTLNISRYSF